MSDIGASRPRDVSLGAVARIVLVVCAVTTGFTLLVAAAFVVRKVLVLGVVASFFAIGLDPVVRRLGKWHIRRPFAVAIVFVGAVVVIGGFVASVSPPLVRQTQHLASQIPDFAERLSKTSGRFADLNERYDISARAREFVKDLPTVVARSAGNVLGVLRTAAGTLFNVLTVIVLTIYLLLGFPQLQQGAQRLVPRSRRERFGHITELVFGRISGYLIGQLGVSIIAGLAAMVALFILRIPYWIPLAIWVSFSAIIPMVGATLGAIPAVIVAFFASPVKGIVTLLYFGIYQQVENTFIHPRVMRHAVDLSPPAVILSALVGATLLGFVGALLAIPIAASVKALTIELWMPRQEEV